MGGTALLIYGDLSPEHLRPRPLPRTWLDRLLGRTRQRGPRVVPHGRDHELVEADGSGLEPLIARFRDFLAREMPDPNEATTQILEYLTLDNIPSLYLRGERERGGEPDWYLQVGFSGCAGMAEVSAAVAEHWAGTWVRRELRDLEREILAPFGFVPRADQPFDVPDRFLPAVELGYLRWVPERERDEHGLIFEVDYAVEESIENTPERLTAASQRHAGLMADGRCRCQLCAPDFRPLVVEAP